MNKNMINCCFQKGGSSGCMGEMEEIFDDVWFHACSTHDMGGTFRIYINGVNNSVLTMTGSSLSDTDGFHIGTNKDNDGEWFNGTIEDVMIFGRALVSEEVTAIFEEQRGGKV